MLLLLRLLLELLLLQVELIFISICYHLFIPVWNYPTRGQQICWSRYTCLIHCGLDAITRLLSTHVVHVHHYIIAYFC
jgi:hypothetical protein